MFSVFFTAIKFVVLLPFLLIYYVYDSLTNKRCKLFGIEGYFGLMGQGKTLSMTRRLLQLRHKYKDSIYIMTNYSFSQQDFAFESWEQLLQDYDKPLVVAWDEVQNEFTSRNFKNFPTELLTTLTQVRKKNGILLLYSAQRWARVDKVFRELSTYCYQCSTKLHVFTILKKYRGDDYNYLCTVNNTDQKFKIAPVDTSSYIHSKKIRNSYDSYQMLSTAKCKDYMSREEVAKIKND